MLRNIVLAGLILLVSTDTSSAAQRTTTKPSSSANTMIFDYHVTINVNDLEMFVSNMGNFAYDPGNVYGKTDGLYYPRGTSKTCIYDAGIWVGAKVDGQTRVAIAEYTTEFIPGPMVNGTHQNDQAAFKVYKIKRGDSDNTNPDWRDWPVSQGAPVDTSGDPALLGDQMTWSVCNDADSLSHTNNAGGTQPLGVEIQQSAFAFATGGAIGKTIFVKFRIINNGGHVLDSAFVSLWVDPDIGDASDDLVGCDTTLSLGYSYNSNADDVYGAAPPAVGAALLQGPIVPGGASDVALMSGAEYPGYRNLRMGSFIRYLNGTDPTTASETYNYMKGLDRNGNPIINPMNARVTKFMVTGNPVTATGWLDSTAADKRMMFSAGPFAMSPGDTQEVVIAVMIGQGNGAVASVEALKQTAQNAKVVYEQNFHFSTSLPAPSVYLRPGDGSVNLVWGSEPVGFVDDSQPGLSRYVFEGFDLYEGESINGPWHRFATCDVENGIALLYSDIFNPSLGGYERVIVQSGTDSGLRFDRTLATSQLDGSPIANGQLYFFAVTAYFYDQSHIFEFLDADGNHLGWVTEVRENPIVGQEVIPTASPGLLSDTALHVSGSSEGMVIVEYLDPSQMTEHNYEVDFNYDQSWNLRDLATGTYKLTSQTHHQADFNFPVVDGMMVRTIGPEPGIGGWQWEGGTRWLTGEDAFGGNLDWLNGGLWNGPDFWGSGIDPLHDYINVEVRFSKINTQKAYDYLRAGTPNYGCIGYFECPFTIWDVSSNPPRQLNVGFVEQNGGAIYDSTWFPGTSGTASREYLIFFGSTYSPNADPFYTSKQLNADSYDMDIVYVLTPKIRAGHDPNVEFVEGQKLIIRAAKPNVQGDIFRFHAGPHCGDMDSDGAVDLADVVYLIRYIFAGGPAPTFATVADANCDQDLNIVDAVYVINYIFSGGPAPCAECSK